MSREWKPGDVAMATGRWLFSEPHWEERAYRHQGEWVNVVTKKRIQDYEVSVVRPLVVIDPEDHLEVTRLMNTFWDQGERGKPAREFGATEMQAALREFADPKPSIEEPKGLGAVVEDAEGVRWLRTFGDPGFYVWRASNKASELPRTFALVNAVRVLSEGVTP